YAVGPGVGDEVDRGREDDLPGDAGVAAHRDQTGGVLEVDEEVEAVRLGHADQRGPRRGRRGGGLRQVLAADHPGAPLVGGLPRRGRRAGPAGDVEDDLVVVDVD